MVFTLAQTKLFGLWRNGRLQRDSQSKSTALVLPANTIDGAFGVKADMWAKVLEYESADC